MSILDGQIPASGSPIFDGGVPLSGFVAPTDYSNPDPQQIDLLQKGGHRCVKELTDRNTITEQRRSFGMLCYVFDDPTPSNNGLYQLLRGVAGGVDDDINNNANWVSFQTGGGSVFIDQFTNTDLVGGFYTVTHNLGNILTTKSVMDDNNEDISIGISNPNSNQIVLDLTDFVPIGGTYTVRVS